ncbi:hypothetical protein GCM10027347_54680 [Larkinella harenae]
MTARLIENRSWSYTSLATTRPSASTSQFIGDAFSKPVWTKTVEADTVSMDIEGWWKVSPDASARAIPKAVANPYTDNANGRR